MFFRIRSPTCQYNRVKLSIDSRCRTLSGMVNEQFKFIQQFWLSGQSVGHMGLLMKHHVHKSFSLRGHSELSFSVTFSHPICTHAAPR